MGMYDTIVEFCPNCNKKIEFQTKGGDCLMEEYTIGDAPLDVLSDANRHSPIKCDCGNSYTIDIKKRKLILDKKVMAQEKLSFDEFLKQEASIIEREMFLKFQQANKNGELLSSFMLLDMETLEQKYNRIYGEKTNVDAERLWEQLMMELVGEDGIGSVRIAIEKLKEEKNQLQEMVNSFISEHPLVKKEIKEFPRNPADLISNLSILNEKLKGDNQRLREEVLHLKARKWCDCDMSAGFALYAKKVVQPTTPPLISMDKKYETVDGLEVVLITIEGLGPHKVVGYVMDFDGTNTEKVPYLTRWLPQGTNFDKKLTLVEVVEKKKVKVEVDIMGSGYVVVKQCVPTDGGTDVIVARKTIEIEYIEGEGL